MAPRCPATVPPARGSFCKPVAPTIPCGPGDGAPSSPAPRRVGMGLDLFNLAGRVALVTGGSKGLGKAMARGLAEAGADVVISSRHEGELRSALDEILQGTGRKGRYVVADMSRRDEAKRLADTALQQMSRIDILINNA